MGRRKYVVRVGGLGRFDFCFVYWNFGLMMSMMSVLVYMYISGTTEVMEYRNAGRSA